MKNITVTVPDDVYRQARIWAAQRDTSISEIVRYILITLPTNKRAARGFPVSGSSSASSAHAPGQAPAQPAAQSPDPPATPPTPAEQMRVPDCETVEPITTLAISTTFTNHPHRNTETVKL
jgi:hypothetical protein